MARRRAAVEVLLAEHDCDHLIFCGLNRFGSAVQWLTQWPVTAEAVGVLTPGKRDALFVQWVNHAPQASLVADKADVAWGGELSIGSALEVLDRRGSRSGRIAYIGPLTAEQHTRLSARYPNIANLTRAYTRLRQVKSAEELDWLRIGAHFTDLGMAALRDGLKPGLNERELGDLVERAYIAQGATNVIHYIGATSMSAPDLGVPRQFAIHAAPAEGRRGGGGNQRGVLGASRAGAAQLRAGRADEALSRPARGGRRRLRCDCRRAQSRRHAGRRDRSVKRDRGRRLHHHRRSACTAMAAVICRRCSAARAVPPARCRRSRSAPGRRWSSSPMS